MTFLGGGYSLLHGGHVKVDFFYQRWSPRTKAVMDLITYLFFFAFCFVLIWYGGGVAWESIKEGRESTSAWAPPLWPSQIMIPLGGLLVGIQGLAKWMRDLAIAWTGKNELTSKLVFGEGGLFEKKKE
jgi:TRAP-type mannitol/chloroaromatic compound transport system permease small subunit